MYGIFNLAGLNFEDAIDKIAKTIIEIDINCHIFGDKTPLWKNENMGGTFIFYPKKVYIYIYNKDIDAICSDGPLLAYEIKKTIYNLKKSLNIGLAGESISAKHQHVLKSVRTVISFQYPLINISELNITSSHNTPNYSNIFIDDCSILFHTNNIATSDKYSLKKETIFDFKILYIKEDIIDFSAEQKVSPFYDESQITYAGKNFNELLIFDIHPLVYGKGIIVDIDGKKSLKPINTYVEVDKITVVETSISFPNIIGPYIESLKPNDKELCKEVVMTMYSCKGDVSKYPPTYKFVKSLDDQSIKKDDIIIITRKQND